MDGAKSRDVIDPRQNEDWKGGQHYFSLPGGILSGHEFITEAYGYKDVEDVR